MKIHYDIINVPEKVRIDHGGLMVMRFAAHRSVRVKSPHTIRNLKRALEKQDRNSKRATRLQLIKDRASGVVEGHGGRARGVEVEGGKSAKPSLLQKIVGFGRKMFQRKAELK